MTRNDQSPPDSPVSRETVLGYWGFGSLTSPLVRSEQTHGAYSIIEQLMPANSGPPPHTHAQSDEVFYILEGSVHLQLSDSVSTAEAGQLVRVPRGVPHAFAVQSEQARMLIFFMPATMDQLIAMTTAPATQLTVPPGPEAEPTEQQMTAFMNHLKNRHRCRGQISRTCSLSSANHPRDHRLRTDISAATLPPAEFEKITADQPAAALRTVYDFGGISLP